MDIIPSEVAKSRFCFAAYPSGASVPNLDVYTTIRAWILGGRECLDSWDLRIKTQDRAETDAGGYRPKYTGSKAER